MDSTRTLDQSDKLRRQMEQFFEATTDAVAFIDRDWRFTFLNRRAEELVSEGLDLIGRNVFEAFPEMVYDGSPFIENYHRTMDQRVSSRFEAYYPTPQDMWFSIQALPTDDGIVVFFHDVTEERRIRAEISEKTAELERQHAELKTIYDTAPIGLAYFDLDDYHYLRLNERQAAFFGLKPYQVVGKTLTEMAPIPGLRELFDQVAGGEPVINYPLEGTLVTDPNEYRYWTVSYFPVYSNDGVIQGITAASQEITQQRKTEQALLQAEKLAIVGRLASSIAHEINNPLESVTNLLYLAAHSDSLPEVRNYVQTAEVELRRVSVIAQQTLRFHKQPSSPQEVDPTEIVTSILSLYQGRIGNAHIHIQQRWRTHRRIRCFEGEIRQVLANLVSNALDAMSTVGGGRLCLRVREGKLWRSNEQGIVITVADTGMGMSPATLARLFNPFFTTKGATGTGLGLWVSKEIVDRHHGVIQIRSSQGPERHGTVFTVFLPIAAAVR